MKSNKQQIVKHSGEKVPYSQEKLQRSLRRCGADEATIKNISDQVNNELHTLRSTQDIYNKAFALLKKKKTHIASKYKLKKAIHELGPTGFPFEQYVSAILNNSGYTTQVGKVLKGKCIAHEIDILAQKANTSTFIECKFHSDQGLKSNIKVPLYIHSRFNDVKAYWMKHQKNKSLLTPGWVVTNTRFTADALKYGQCSGLYLLSWDLPENEGLKDRIDHLGLYPVTVSTILSAREKQFLLSRDLVLYRDLIDDTFYLEHLGVSKHRKLRIIKEIKQLCEL